MKILVFFPFQIRQDFAQNRPILGHFQPSSGHNCNPLGLFLQSHVAPCSWDHFEPLLANIGHQEAKETEFYRNQKKIFFEILGPRPTYLQRVGDRV